MIRLVEVFCATQRHQKTKNKKNESQTKVRMAFFTTGIDGALQNSEDLYINKRPYRRVQQSCHTRSRQGSWSNVCVTLCVCECSREHSRVYVQQETSSLQH